jgi:hypothetical protein
MSFTKQQNNSYYFKQIVKYARMHPDGFSFNSLKTYIVNNELNKNIHDKPQDIKDLLDFWFSHSVHGFKTYCIKTNNKKQEIYKFVEKK